MVVDVGQREVGRKFDDGRGPSVYNEVVAEFPPATHGFDRDVFDLDTLPTSGTVARAMDAFVKKASVVLGDDGQRKAADLFDKRRRQDRDNPTVLHGSEIDDCVLALSLDFEENGGDMDPILKAAREVRFQMMMCAYFSHAIDGGTGGTNNFCSAWDFYRRTVLPLNITPEIGFFTRLIELSGDKSQRQMVAAAVKKSGVSVGSLFVEAWFARTENITERIDMVYFLAMTSGKMDETCLRDSLGMILRSAYNNRQPSVFMQYLAAMEKHDIFDCDLVIELVGRFGGFWRQKTLEYLNHKTHEDAERGGSGCSVWSRMLVSLM